MSVGEVLLFGNPPMWLVWIVSLVLVALAMFMAGRMVTGYGLGVLIDVRNKTSLAQLQIVLWTILILGTLLAYAIAFQTMNFSISNDLLALMGISVVTAGGSGVIKAVQSDPANAQPEMPEGEPGPGVEQMGRLARNRDRAKARIRDLIETESYAEAGAPRVDLGKLQMLIITMIVIFGYAVTLIRQGLIISDGTTYKFPEFNDSVVVLLLISHAGYLAMKAVPAASPPQTDATAYAVAGGTPTVAARDGNAEPGSK